jgi:hypothetical protein
MTASQRRCSGMFVRKSLAGMLTRATNTGHVDGGIELVG